MSQHPNSNKQISKNDTLLVEMRIAKVEIRDGKVWKEYKPQA
jgi:hypothetical protein